MLTWMRRNWKWLVFPVGLLLLILGFLARGSRRGVVAVPEFPDPSRPLREVDKQEKLETAKIEEHAREATAAEYERHEQETAKIEDVEQERFDEMLAKDDQEVAGWLTDLLRKP